MPRRLLFVLLAALLLASDRPRISDAVTPPPLEVTSRSEVREGLQVAVKSVRREGGKVYFVYTFRWVGKPGFAFQMGYTIFDIYFWDANGQMIVPGTNYGLVFF